MPIVRATQPMTRHERESAQWISMLGQYAIEKETIDSGGKPSDKSLDQWIHRQRSLHKLGKLQDWKRKLLREAHFSFTPVYQMTNELYATELVAFHLTHGHYSPTQSVGGAGLTKWWRNMQASDGRMGLISESEESALTALKILKERIPDFKLDAPGKASINQAKGLSFNGYCKQGARNSWENDTTVRASWFYSTKTQEIANLIGFQCGFPEIEDLFFRAAHLSQAVRVEMDGQMMGWALAVSSPTTSGLTIACAKNLAGDALFEFVLGPVIRSGYSPDGSRYEVVIAGAAGESYVIGYDALLADQTSRLFAGQFEDEDQDLQIVAPPVDWQVWLQGNGSARRQTPLTTSNKHFELQLRELKKWIVKQQGADSLLVPHITWATDFDQYKFIEHMLLKRKTGHLRLSHAERLRGLNATWGKNKRSLKSLVGARMVWVES